MLCRHIQTLLGKRPQEVLKTLIDKREASLRLKQAAAVHFWTGASTYLRELNTSPKLRTLVLTALSCSTLVLACSCALSAVRP